MSKSLNSKANWRKILKTEGSSLSRIYGTLGRNLVMFSRIKTMLEEYVRSLSRAQKEEPYTNQPTAMRGKSFRVKVPPPSPPLLPLSRDQVLNIHLNNWLLKVNFSYKGYLNNNLTSYITESDSPQNNEPLSRQPLILQETFSAKPGRVLNNHLRISILLFGLYVSMHVYFCGYMCGGGIFKTHLNINSQRSKYK